MPFNVNRGPAVIVEKEILRSAAGLDDIMSMVVDSTYVKEHPISSGRYILEAGTVLCAIESSSKLQPLYNSPTTPNSSSGLTVVGILGHTREFFLETSLVTASLATDEPVPVLHHGCHFDTAFLVGYASNESAVAAALPTCIFSTAGPA
jgi:hypothetical protein